MGTAEPAGSWAVSPAVRRSMQGNRRRDTTLEWQVRRRLHAAGFRYRVDAPLEFDRRRRADITFPTQRLVVFLDGCFWHGCPQHYVPPKSHVEYWSAKVAGNMARDRQTDEQLRLLGWRVNRYWAHQDPDDIAADIAAVLRPQPAEAVEDPGGRKPLALPMSSFRPKPPGFLPAVNRVLAAFAPSRRGAERPGDQAIRSPTA